MDFKYNKEDSKLTKIDRLFNFPIANIIAFYLCMRGNEFINDNEKSKDYVLEKYRRYILSDVREEWLWGLHPRHLTSVYNHLRAINYKFNYNEALYLYECNIMPELVFKKYKKV